MLARRRLLAVGLWACVTTVATAVVWAGTSTVVADLTDRPPPVVDHHEVVQALAPGPPDDKTEPGITNPPPPGPTAAAPGPSPDAGAAARDDAAAAPSGSVSPPPPVNSPTPATSPPTTAAPSPPPTEPPSGQTATFSTPGGTATVTCTGPFGFFIEFVSATPNVGWAVRVTNPGPYYVEVHFVRPGRDEPLWAYCMGEPVRAYGGPPR